MNKKKEIEKIDSCINELVYEKVQIKKAYNYYHCIRDAEQFRHIEENYGLGTPTTMGFTPLVKKHIDVLVGEYLGLDPEVSISCKDDETISNIMRDKKLEIDKQLFSFLKKYLKNSIINIILGTQQPQNDPFIEKEMQKIKDNVDKSFISEYELTAQNVLEYFKNSRDLDLKNKLAIILTDLLISGLAYFRVEPSGAKDNVVLEALNPIDTFVERNRNEFYLNKSPRAVVRKWLTKDQILAKYGEELNAEAKEKIDSYFTDQTINSNTIFVRTPAELHASGTKTATANGILGGLEVAAIPNWDFYGANNYINSRVIPVFECEWLVYEDGKMNRHEGVRIGEEVYITRGISENIIRSRSNPKECTLSVNGLFFSDRNGNPFSLVLNTMDLQDRYDLLLYYRDNLIATSGTVGDWIDLASIPSALGVDMPTQVQKWLAYKKNGIALFDSSQEGANIINTSFNGFDDTVKAQSIQAIQLAIQSVEEQVSSITGVLGQALGNIEQRDAVSNVKVGVRTSMLLTKQYFHAMDLIFKAINYDLLNMAKIVFKNGLTGSIILGDKVRIFTALPKYFTTTDFDIHIKDSSEEYQTRENIKQLNVEFIKGGLTDADMAINIMTAKTTAELKNYVNTALTAKKAENNMIQQLQQQLEQANGQLKQLQQQAEQLSQQNNQLQQKLQTNNDEKLQIERERLKLEKQANMDRADYNDKMLELKNKQIEVEIHQQWDGNPYNDKIKDI